MNKITSINGILLAPLNELNEHVENGTVHVTEGERTAWNAKANASDVDFKVSTDTFNTHTENTIVHVTAAERSVWNDKQGRLTDESGNMTLDGELTTTVATNANGGINLVSELAPERPKTALNAGAAAVLDVLGNVYHIDHVNGSTLTVLDGTNVKMEYVLQGWCGLSWNGTNLAHKCVLVQSGITNSNYGGGWSPIIGQSSSAIVFSILSGVNLSQTKSKWGISGTWAAITGTTIEELSGPIFYVDCDAKKLVAKSFEGQLTELSWSSLSLDYVSRMDMILVPETASNSRVYLALHRGVESIGGLHCNFNRSNLSPVVHELGIVNVGLTSNDVQYAVLDTCSEQMALFRVSVVQGINMADYLNITTI